MLGLTIRLSRNCAGGRKNKGDVMADAIIRLHAIDNLVIALTDLPKGATPAGKGVLGVIPGSMTAPGYIVRGTGVVESLGSASHGATSRSSSSLRVSPVRPRRTPTGPDSVSASNWPGPMLASSRSSAIATSASERSG